MIYKIGDKVDFDCCDTIKSGKIFIVDRYGTFERPGVVSYDIDCESEDILYKHVTYDLAIGFSKEG